MSLNRSAPLISCGCVDSHECCASRESLTVAMQAGAGVPRQEIINIPIVFNCTGNLSQANDPNLTDRQLEEQVKQLNADFSATNADRISNCPASMLPSLAGDARINFYIQDIKRLYSSVLGDKWHSLGWHRYLVMPDGYGARETMTRRGFGGINPTDAGRALNVYCCYFSPDGSPEVTSGIVVGQAYFPTNTPARDGDTHDEGGLPGGRGIIMQSEAIGSLSSPAPVSQFAGSAVLSGGRVLTHEVGHFLGLPHSWGDSQQVWPEEPCFADNSVTDLPPHSGPFGWGLVAYPPGEFDNGCGPEPYNNIMNYGNYISAFTKDQVERMRNVRAYLSTRYLGTSVRPIKAKSLASVAIGSKYADRLYYGSRLLWSESSPQPDPQPAAPPAPMWVSMKAIDGVAESDGSVQLSWGAPPTDPGVTVTGYEIEASADGGFSWASSWQGAETAATITGLRQGSAWATSSWVFRVRALSSHGTSAWSPASTPVTPLVPYTEPWNPNSLPQGNNWKFFGGGDSFGNAHISISVILLGEDTPRVSPVHNRLVEHIIGGGSVVQISVPRVAFYNGRYYTHTHGSTGETYNVRVAVAMTGPPYLVIYELIDGEWVRQPNLLTEPVPSRAIGCQFHPSGERLAVIYETEPYITIYIRNADGTFSPTPLPYVPAGRPRKVHWDWIPSTGNATGAGVLFVTHENDNQITAYGTQVALRGGRGVIPDPYPSYCVADEVGEIRYPIGSWKDGLTPELIVGDGLGRYIVSVRVECLQGYLMWHYSNNFRYDAVLSSWISGYPSPCHDDCSKCQIEENRISDDECGPQTQFKRGPNNPGFSSNPRPGKIVFQGGTGTMRIFFNFANHGVPGIVAMSAVSENDFGGSAEFFELLPAGPAQILTDWEFVGVVPQTYPKRSDPFRIVCVDGTAQPYMYQREIQTYASPTAEPSKVFIKNPYMWRASQSVSLTATCAVRFRWH